MEKIYDCIIVGGGPSGLAASIYLTRGGADVLVLEKNMPGGQVGLTSSIENYPGIQHIEGYQLATNFFNHAKAAGGNIVFQEVIDLDIKGKIKTVTTKKAVYKSRFIIFALGASPRTLGIDNESSLIGRGLGYCTTCDAPLYKDKVIAVVGGGNSAVEDALYAEKFASRVFLIHRRDSLRAERVLQNALFSKSTEKNIDGKIEILWDSHITEVFEDDFKVCGIEVSNVKTQARQNIDVDAVFVSIGRTPATDLLKDKVKLDEYGYIVPNKTTLRTSVKGVYVAGDCRVTPLRQVVTAAADGAIAASQVLQELAKVK